MPYDRKQRNPQPAARTEMLVIVEKMRMEKTRAYRHFRNDLFGQGAFHTSGAAPVNEMKMNTMLAAATYTACSRFLPLTCRSDRR